MRIFDAHFHIDKGFDDYQIDRSGCNVIFNSFEQYNEKRNEVPEGYSVTLIYDYKRDINFIHEEIKANRVNAIKIHSRIQKLREADWNNLIVEIEKTLVFNVPVLIDAFYYGTDYDCQANLGKIIELIKKYPNTNFIIAHAGGIKVLEYFLHLRTLPNVYFELSFSLSYLKYASVMADFKVLLRFGIHDNIIFGTDYPFISETDQLNCFLEIANELKMSEASIEKILYSNAAKLYKIKSL